MKKPKKSVFNKTTLVLAFVAVGCWCFYFWQEKENQEFILETQLLVHETTQNTISLKEEENYAFVKSVRSSFWDSVHYVKRSFIDSSSHTYNYEKLEKHFDKITSNIVLDTRNKYEEAISDYESEFLFKKKWDKNYKYNKEFRTILVQRIKENLEAIKNQSPTFAKVTLPNVNWNEKDDLLLWLDLARQREQVISIKDSIITENKKQFPTSYTSDNFEGYSTLIPDYKNQKMIIKAYWFPSATKFYSSLFGKKTVYPFAEEQRANFFKFNDSIYWEMKTPITYHVFDRVGDTIVFPTILQERLNRMSLYEQKMYKIPFKVVPKK